MSWKDQPSYRSQNMARDWKRRREAVIAREKGQCQFVNPNSGSRCDSRGTEVHHTSRYTHAIETLVLLCSWHHERITVVEAAQGRIAARKRREVTQKHPGLR